MSRKEYKLPNGKKAVFEYDVCGIGKVTLECMDELMGMIADAPSIDIVRCKECKHWDNTDNAERCSYEYGGMWAKPDDFCSYGEREGE